MWKRMETKWHVQLSWRGRNLKLKRWIHQRWILPRWPWLNRGRLVWCFNKSQLFPCVPEVNWFLSCCQNLEHWFYSKTSYKEVASHAVFLRATIHVLSRVPWRVTKPQGRLCGRLTRKNILANTGKCNPFEYVSFLSHTWSIRILLLHKDVLRASSRVPTSFLTRSEDLRTSAWETKKILLIPQSRLKHRHLPPPDVRRAPRHAFLNAWLSPKNVYVGD